MGEQAFDSGGGGGGRWDDDLATIAAAELAEELLVELARARHSWELIAALADRLAVVARAARDGG